MKHPVETEKSTPPPLPHKARMYEIKFLGCIARERVESTLTLEGIAAQLASGWLIIGEKIINAAIVEAVVEVEVKEEKK